MKDNLEAVGLTVYMRVNMWGVPVEAMVDRTLDLRMYYWTDSSKMTSDPYKGIVAKCPWTIQRFHPFGAFVQGSK